MPVVGSSAYNTAGQITALVRSLLNDAAGNLFTDTVLLPYANSAYRKLQRAIGNARSGNRELTMQHCIIRVSVGRHRGQTVQCTAQDHDHQARGAAAMRK